MLQPTLRAAPGRAPLSSSTPRARSRVSRLRKQEPPATAVPPLPHTPRPAVLPRASVTRTSCVKARRTSRTCVVLFHTPPSRLGSPPPFSLSALPEPPRLVGSRCYSLAAAAAGLLRRAACTLPALVRWPCLSAAACWHHACAAQLLLRTCARAPVSGESPGRAGEAPGGCVSPNRRPSWLHAEAPP